MEWQFEKKIFNCNNTQLRIINYIIYHEYVKARLENRIDWAFQAQAKLLQYDIRKSIATLISMLNKIKVNKRNPASSSGFVGNLNPQSRYEKDMFYSKLDVYVHEILDEVFYIGLPANQLISVANKYNNVIACETNINMFEFMNGLNTHIIKNKNVVVENKDIFYYLNNTERKFNLYDLDLMEALDEGRIIQIVDIIKKTAMNLAVIMLVSIGGRHISTKEYEALMPSILLRELKKKDFNVVNKPFSGRYKDNVMPMRVEIVVITK